MVNRKIKAKYGPLCSVDHKEALWYSERGDNRSGPNTTLASSSSQDCQSAQVVMRVALPPPVFG